MQISTSIPNLTSNDWKTVQDIAIETMAEQQKIV